MSLNRYAKRRDENESALIAIARAFGAQIEIHGPLDLWVGWRQCWFPVEVKGPKGRYTQAQIEFLERCKARNTPVWTWREARDVFECFGALESA